MYSIYLTNLGLRDFIEKDNQDLINQGKLNRVMQHRVYKDQYGIDLRDTYDVEQSIYEYIYCILMEYKNQATIINFHYHTVEYKGVVWYQDEVIDRVLNAIKQWLLFRNEDYPFYLGIPIENELKDSLHLFIEIMECMWWYVWIR